MSERNRYACSSNPFLVGTGKTHLTSKVIDHVKQTLKPSQHDEGFAYFYCQRSGSSMQDPMDVLKSFVRQLAGKAFDERGLIRSSLIKRYCKDLILDSFDMYPKTTIVLDALDESDISTHNLGSILVELMVKSKKPVKIFISTRPDREYLEGLFRDSRIITVDASNQKEDIERYLHEKLYLSPFFQRRNQEIQAEIRDVFATKSRGMFRWVHLQVNSLQRCTTDDAIHAWSRKLPSNLTEAYDQLWQRIQEYDASDVSLAERAITWVLCATWTLKVETLLEAIRYDLQGPDVVRKEKQTQQQILALCQDLLTIDGGYWTLPHASVAEYFEWKGWARWKCDLFAAKVYIAFLPNCSPEEAEGDFAVDARFSWTRHVRRYEEWLEWNPEVEADADLAMLLERFLRWGNSPRFAYRRVADPQRQPDHVVLQSICEMGLWHTMRHWWRGGQITREMALMQDGSGNNALHSAAEGGCMRICRHLIGLVFDPENLQSERHTYISTLSAAVEARNIDLVKVLMREVNLDVDVDFSEKGGASLAQLAARHAPDILQWFIGQGWVDLEREDASGFVHGNVLVAAAAGRSDRSVQLLLDAGVNVNSAVRNGRYGSALIAAAARGNIRSVQLLLDAGANVNATSDCGIYGNALTAAANRPEVLRDRPTFIRLLMDYGADPNMPLKGGNYGSVLEAVVAQEPRKNQIALLHLLLKAGMDPLAELEHGEYGNALATAAFGGKIEVLKVMVAHVGREQAIDALHRSRHPTQREFERTSEVEAWQSTVEYLAKEVGISKEELDASGLRSLSETWRDSFDKFGYGRFTLELG
ncbi:ankyrin [Trichoderma longibrachiatum ATCC 18648]|uniref:Ankyrin n=1 Tax=Trichoderma longibrachiatum ATCC 18648 TaxID=983965 RepID=A0A2T4BSV9_TRILO|nr:ankyrin [Trichoderma longibrachiatum ATCC 18648]